MKLSPIEGIYWDSLKAMESVKIQGFSTSKLVLREGDGLRFDGISMEIETDVDGFVLPCGIGTDLVTLNPWRFGSSRAIAEIRDPNDGTLGKVGRVTQLRGKSAPIIT
jgi:hypothetical protein